MVQRGSQVNEQQEGYAQIIVTQQAQLIDVMMVLLEIQNPGAAKLVDYIHNTRNLIMSELTEEELLAIKEELL